jgi:hypothetical protein
MRVPAVMEPQKYSGLYVFDFGEWSAVGYTAGEIAMLLESEQYAAGKVYKIHRAHPDGTMELRGVSRARFDVESGLIFYRAERAAAEQDYARLVDIAAEDDPPCRSFIHIVDRGEEDAGVNSGRFATVLAYPAEFEEEISTWLTRNAYEGGDYVEGGPSAISNYRAERPAVLLRTQLWNAGSARSAEEVFRDVRKRVQR